MGQQYLNETELKELQVLSYYLKTGKETIDSIIYEVFHTTDYPKRKIENELISLQKMINHMLETFKEEEGKSGQ